MPRITLRVGKGAKKEQKLVGEPRRRREEDAKPSCA
jgi:hypothetical protein